MPILTLMVTIMSFYLFYVSITAFIKQPKIREETLYWAAAMFTLFVSFLIQTLGYFHIISIYLFTIYIVFNLNYLAWLLEYRALFIILKYNHDNIPLIYKKLLRVLGLLSLWIFIIFSPIIGAYIDGAGRIILNSFFIPNIFDYMIIFYFVNYLVLAFGVLLILWLNHSYGKTFKAFAIGFSLITLKDILYLVSMLIGHCLEFIPNILGFIGALIIFYAVFSLFRSD